MHQSIPAAPRPPPSPPPLPPGYRGTFANFALPGDRAFANPWAFPDARGFLSEYNYTEDITKKKSRLAHLSKTGGC